MLVALRFVQSTLQVVALPQRSQLWKCWLVVHILLAVVGIGNRAHANDDITQSLSNSQNNAHHELGWVPNRLLGDLAPNPICCGRYLRHGFEPVTDQRLLFQSLNFEGNQTHGWFGGEVRLRSESAMLVSRDLTYDKEEGFLSLRYPSSLYQGDVAIKLKEGYFSLKDKILRGDDSQFVYLPRHFRGAGKRVVYDLNAQYIDLDSALVTYCAPDDSAWSIRASSIHLDFVEQRGYAYNMRFNLGPIPIIYAPFYTFPLHSRRESGLLDPQIWQSNRHGFVYHQPYYLNLAPNYDSTLYLTSMTNHGAMTSVEGRLLTGLGASFLGYSHLDRDSNASVDLPSATRSYLTLRQSGQLLGGKLSYGARWDEVSDTKQLVDVPNIFGQGAADTVPRRASFSYTGDFWSLNSAWQDYQIADSVAVTDYPYAYRPRARLQSSELAGFSYSLDYMNFGRDIRDELSESQLAKGDGINGERSNQSLSYNYRQARSWGFASFTGHGHKQSYRLRDQGDIPARSDNYYRQLEIDSGLIFARELASGGSQSLEPRLYYAYSPFVDQNALPDIDSSLSSPSLGSIFRPNSFTGGDRFEDSDRLSVGLSSEVRTATGNRLWLGELGRAYYLQPRRVTLDANDSEQQQSFANTRPQSPVFGRSTFLPNPNWRVIVDAAWHQSYSTLLNQALSLNYNQAEFGLWSLSYSRKLDEDDESVDEQSDTTLIKNLGEQVKVFARWRYNLEERQEQQLLRGIEYQSCCWRVRLGAYTNLTEEDDEAVYDRGWALQFNFTGLTSINYDRDREDNERLKSGIESVFNGIPGL